MKAGVIRDEKLITSTNHILLRMPQVSEAVLIVLTDWQYRLLKAASKCLSYFIANPKGFEPSSILHIPFQMLRPLTLIDLPTYPHRLLLRTDPIFIVNPVLCQSKPFSLFSISGLDKWDHYIPNTSIKIKSQSKHALPSGV